MNRLDQLLNKAQATHLTFKEQVELKELHANKLRKMSLELSKEPKYPNKPKFKISRL